MNSRIHQVHYKSPYKRVLNFNNDERKIFDFRDYLQYPVYKHLANEAFYADAKVMMSNVTWNDEIDFDPNTLYLQIVAISTSVSS